MHPLNLWLLPGRLGRTFQVTNKGLFFFFFFVPFHRHTRITRHPSHITRSTSAVNGSGAHMEDGTTGGEGRRIANPARIPEAKWVGRINPQRSTHGIKSKSANDEIKPGLEGGSESKHIHALFIILKLWRNRFVRSQGAKQRVESVEAMLRYAHLIIAGVGRWVKRKKGHWRLTLRHPPSTLFLSLPLTRQYSHISTALVP